MAKRITCKPRVSGLLDILAPAALDFAPRHMIFNDQYARVIAIVDYPPRVQPAWISKIANMPGVTASIHMHPTDPYELVQSINKSIGELLGRINNGGSPLVIQRAEQQYKDAMELLRKIDQEQQNVFYFACLLMLAASDLDTLDKRTRSVESSLAASGMRGRTVMFRQEDALKAAGPYAILPDCIHQICVRNMPSESVAAAFPFTDSGINDLSGFILGRDKRGGIILIDIWKRGGDRTNSNFTVLGKPGVGKSTAVKKVLLNEYARGTKVIIIDPEREYGNICREVNGDLIDCGGGVKGKINPLQVKLVPLDDLDDEEEVLYTQEATKKGSLSLHLQTLRTFFKLYIRELTDIDLALLEEILEELYFSFNIQWDTDPESIPNDKWPIMSDLYNLVKQKAAIDTQWKPNYEKLSVLLRRAAKGADSSLWNGATTIKADSDFVVLDINSLQESDEVIKRAQYFNVLTWAWNEIVRDRSEKKILAVDEVYLLIDTNNPQTLQFLRNTSKRIRKYMGSLMVISQNVVDFLDPAVKRYGQALLDNPCFKLIMGQGEKDLEALSKLMNLSESEIEMLSKGKRGEALLVAGSKRVHAMVELTDFEPDIFGKGGGN